MHDLNLILFYKTSFQIRALDGDGDALWGLVCNIRNWMTSKWCANGIDIPYQNAIWSQFKTGSSITSEDPEGAVRFYSSAYWDSESVNYWACSITETVTVKGFAPRQWVTEIGFAYKEPTYGTISIVLSHGDWPGYLGECQEEPGLSIPGIVGRLVNDSRLACEICGMPLELGARMLRVGDFPRFWDVIADENRDVPVIYISPKRYAVDGLFAIDPQEVAQSLGPSAIVYYALDTSFGDEMRASLPNSDYKCYNGFVRVYAAKPCVNDPTDPGRHRYFPPSVIEEMGDEGFIRMLRRALAQDVHFYESMVRLDVVKSKVRRIAVTKRAEGQVKLAENRVKMAEEESMELMIDLEDEMVATQRENERLQHELDELRSKNYSLEARAQVAENALSGRKGTTVIDEIDMHRYSPQALAELFATIYVDRIDFTERGIKTLGDCNTRPDVLWNALYDLCTIAYELHTNHGEADIAKAFNSKSEFEYSRGAGMMTRKDPKLIEQYRDSYRGREIDVESHIKKGNKESSDQFIRIYFGFDGESQKIIISSVGQHLNTYSTKFMR